MFRRAHNQTPTSPPGPASATVEVLGAKTAYVEAGTGHPIVLLNAGLGASTVWRDLVPPLSDRGRVIAVDLVGTGASARIEPESHATYNVERLRTHFDAFLHLVGIRDPVTIVVLGLASMVAFDWAAAFPDRVRAICHMESILEPWTLETTPAPTRAMLERARSDDALRYAVYSDSHLEDAMRTQAMPPLDAAASQRYRIAYGPGSGNRRLQLDLLQQIPIDGKPTETTAMVTRYRDWLERTDIPKLLILGRPGFYLQGELAESARQLPRQEVAEVVGTHLLPEDAPSGVLHFLSSWLEKTAQKR